jgi:formylglycine-generating enzyme required for sulfatase activity
MRSLLVLAALLFAFPAQAEITFNWVTVGDPGNACELHLYQGCFGAVAYEYRISKFEVTNSQYAEFLNAVAATDTYALYNTNMGSVGSPDYGSGITRSGSPGPYTYSTIAGRENMPVNWVSFWDATRFANWLHNGQPTGAQDNTTTEDGAYTLTPTGITNNTVTRNAGAEVFVTSEDEWYKAAYYGGVSMSYNPYPFADGFNGVLREFPPGTTSHSANCNSIVDDLTGVGSYTGSPSSYSTFDQGGNVWEWNEAISGVSRVLRGGGFVGAPISLAASSRAFGSPSLENGNMGFRVASRDPAAPVPSLGPVGLLLVAAGLLGFGAYRRGRA